MNESFTSSDALIEDNLALIGYSVNEVCARVPAHVSRADLASAGALALVRAARGFDASKGVPFARYASMRIRGALIDELRSMDWAPRAARRRARDVAAIADTLAGELGRNATTAEIARSMGVDASEVEAARVDMDTRVLSIDAYDGAVAEMVVDSTTGPADALLGAERLGYLRAGVDSLPEKLRHVVEQLFFHDRPVVELAEEMGVTRSRISQLRTEALGMLKDGLNANLESDAPVVVDPAAGVADRRRQAYYASIAARAAQARGTAAVAPTLNAVGHLVDEVQVS
ncbi:sigma-70 family RNA polymerase sigma factor [Demequina aestuarii]|uniref:sigma-70 family RNA polymerase sigma factor n=1 Tax=Demequina aestuarii TaxID=327095 RepID=UPI000781E222|nr:sigma-70 family RNA polymerase sigma factor [Demequina aestuarii]